MNIVNRKPEFLLLFFGFNYLCALNPSAAAEPEIVVTFSEEGSAINDVEILLTPSVSELIRLWGEPDRVSKLQNHVRIWDDLGVRSYSTPGAPSADTLTFTMKKQELKISSKEIFDGVIRLPKGAITAKSTAADLKRLGFVQDATLEKFFRLDLLVASFLAEVDTKDGSLVAISMDFGF